MKKMPKSQVSLAVNSLCRRGLLEGVYSEGNRKSIHLKLKENADPIVAYGKKVQGEFSKLLFSDFTESERAEFSRLHSKIAENIKAKKED